MILITCDTLRADHLGVYGFEHDTSPEIDALAREGVVFERAYSTAPMTLPSVCSMLSGRLPGNIGVENNWHFLHEKVQTLAEELTRHGIPTAAAVSNWVLLNYPDMPPEHGVWQGFEHYDATLPSREAVRGMPERTARDTTSAAIEWLASRGADAPERFFLWVHYQDPHGPYTPPQHFVQMMQRPHGDEPELPFGTESSGLAGIPRYQQLGDERHPDFYRARYDAEIRYFDRQVGRLLAYLGQHDLLRDSLLILSADHGESLGEGDYWFTHGETLNLELVHVPLVVRFPEHTPLPPPGQDGVRRVSRVVSQLDIWPTVMAAFDLDPGPCAGTSLWELDAPQAIAVQSLDPGRNRRVRVAIIDGDWRLHLRGDQPSGLFDLARDPGEVEDLREAHPEVVERMLARYRELVARDAASVLDAQERAMSAEERRIMEGLGYSGDGDDADDALEQGAGD